MHIRARQSGIRDFQADWKDWSRAERIAAGVLVTIAGCLVGTILLLQL